MSAASRLALPAPWPARSWARCARAGGALAARERRLVALAAAVLGAFLLWTVAVQPAWRTLRDAPAQREALDAQLQTMQRAGRRGAAAARRAGAERRAGGRGAAGGHRAAGRQGAAVAAGRACRAHAQRRQQRAAARLAGRGPRRRARAAGRGPAVARRAGLQRQRGAQPRGRLVRPWRSARHAARWRGSAQAESTLAQVAWERTHRPWRAGAGPGWRAARWWRWSRSRRPAGWPHAVAARTGSGCCWPTRAARVWNGSAVPVLTGGAGSRSAGRCPAASAGASACAAWRSSCACASPAA